MALHIPSSITLLSYLSSIAFYVQKYIFVYKSTQSIFMLIHHTLDEVFRSWSHVAVLRALLDTTNGFTGNEVARVAGMQPRSAFKALTALEELGMVRRQRGGRDHLFTLNREHFLIRDAILPLYHSELQFSNVVVTALSTILKKPVLCAVIFGSVAREEETPRSDLDLCCMVQKENEKDIVREMLDSESSSLYRKFGVKVAPVFFTLAEFRQRAKKKNPLIREIIEHGKVIVGKNPKVLLNG